jgi:tubulin beta
VCGEHGIGGSGEYCGDSDAQLGRINVFYHVVTVKTCVGTAA